MAIENKFLDLSLVLYLNDIGLNYSHIVILQYLIDGTDYKDIPRCKIKNDLKTLGFVFEDQITERGEKLLLDVAEWSEVWQPEIKPQKKEKSKELFSKEFLEFWDTFPAIDAFTINNIPFRGTRSMRSGKNVCNAKYNMILKEDKYTHEDILRALRYEIQSRKDQSLTEGKNNLSWMKGTESYLQNRVFEAYIDLSRRPYEPVSGKQADQIIKTEELF